MYKQIKSIFDTVCVWRAFALRIKKYGHYADGCSCFDKHPIIIPLSFLEIYSTQKAVGLYSGNYGNKQQQT